MVEVEGVSESVYVSMKEQIHKLPPSLQFTLFPKKTGNGKIDVGFFYKTDIVNLKKGKTTDKVGPYVIPKIASVVLACSLLENPEMDKEYEEKMKKNKEIMNQILEMFYDEDTIYFIPATIGKNNFFNVFMDESVYYDFNDNNCPDYDSFEKFVISKMSGLNHTLIPMTEQEYKQYKNEITLNPKLLSFYKKVPAPEYMPPETMRGKQISERLIDILNRKREQVMLMSDDFNGKNLMNIENYISGSVQEIIMREDEDYTDWLENDEILDRKELDLLKELDEKYKISFAYEDHDKVSELIQAERNSIEKSIENKEEKDFAR